MKPVITRQRRYNYAEDKLRSLAQQIQPRVVFDVGAGEALMRAPTVEAGLTWHGFDQRSLGGDVVRWDLSDPCPLRQVKAGMVLLMDVIEHLLNPGLALDHISEVMAERSYIIITTPNPRASRSRLHALFTGFPTCFTKQDLLDNHHVFPVWQHVLEHMLVTRGFEILEWCQLRGRHTIPAPALQLRYPLRVGKALLCRFIEAMDPTAASIDYGVLARKR